MNKLLVPFFLLLFFSSFSQKEELENVKLAVDTLFFSDKEKALLLCESNIIPSKAIGDTFYITYFLDQAGELNRYLGHLDKAESQLKECLQFKAGWEDLKDLSLTYNNLGKTYKMLGAYELAYSNFLKALDLMEIDGNLIGQGYYLNNIGALFDEQKNHLKAIEYYNRSLKIKQITNDTSGIASTSLNMGIAYYELADYNRALTQFYYAYNSTSYQSLSNKKVRAIIHISKTLQKLNKENEGLKFLNQTHKHLAKVDDEVLKAELFNAFSETYLAINVLDSSSYYNNQALYKAKEIGASQLLQTVYFVKSQIFEKKNESDSALVYLKRGILYYDSLATEASINAVLQMEAKYNTERNLRLRQAAEIEAIRVKEILQLKEMQTLYLILVLTIITMITVFVLLKYRANKQSSELINGQKVLIEKQNRTLFEINERLKLELQNEKFNAEQKSEILNNVFSKSNKVDLPVQLLSLSRRETEVLANLALGLTDDQLAAKLFVSKSTIKTHLRRIYAKLLVKSRAQAVAIAHKHGIIGSDLRTE